MPETMPKTITDVYVVDSDISVRESLKALLCDEGFRVRTFSSAEGFLKEMSSVRFGCAILEVNLPGLDGLELQELLQAECYSVPIIFITGYGNVTMSVRAIKNGAVEFLTKPFHNDTVVTAVRSALDKSRRSQVVEADLGDLRARYAQLTPRERTVMPLVAAGIVNKSAGIKLEISEFTVKAHRASMMRKMKADSLASLIKMAFKLQISIPMGM